MTRGRSAERQVLHFLEIKPQELIELLERKMVHVGLLSREPFTAQHFPAPVQVIIERRGANIRAARVLL
jgi:hypothetical protein